MCCVFTVTCNVLGLENLLFWIASLHFDLESGAVYAQGLKCLGKGYREGHMLSTDFPDAVSGSRNCHLSLRILVTTSAS